MSKVFNRALALPKQSGTPSAVRSSYLSVILDAESGIDGLQNNVFLDSAPSPKTMTVFGESHQGRFSPFAKHWSASFNGTSQYAVVSNRSADIQLGMVFTIDAWFCLTSNLTFKTAANSYMGRILSGSAASSIEFTVSGSTAVPTNISLGRVGTTGLIAGTNLNIEIGVWHHVAVTRNAAGVLSMFFNGVRVATVTTTGLASASVAHVAGINLSGWYGYFPGYLSNIRVVKDSTVYDPTLTTCAVPTNTLEAVPGTSLLLFTKSNFVNQVNPGGTVSHSATPRMLPIGPFKNENIAGGSAYFDGNGDYVRTNNHLDLSPEGQDFCMESFVYFMPGAANVVFFSKVEGAYPAGFEWGLSLTGGNTINMSLIQQTGASLVLSTTAAVIGGQWYHVAATRKGTTASLFVNGIRAATQTITNSVRTNSAGLTVGKDLETSQNRPLTGYLSNSRFVKGDFVYDPTLTTLTVPEAPLTAIAGTGLLLKYENSGIHDTMGLLTASALGNARGRTDVKVSGSGAMYFDGTGDYLQIPHQEALNLSRGDFTIRGWVRIDSLPTSGNAFTIVDKDGISGQKYASYALLIDSSAKLVGWTGNGLGLNPSGTSYVSTASLTVGQLHHFVFQRSGSTISIYTDGVLTLTAPVGVSPVDGGNRLCVGGNFDLTTRYLNGFIDKLEIAQGKALYTGNFTPE